MTEDVELVNRSDRELPIILDLIVAADLADMELVKSGRPGRAVEPFALDCGVRFSAGGVSSSVLGSAADITMEVDAARLRWQLTVAARSSAAVTFSVVVSDRGAVVSPADPATGFAAPTVSADDRRLAPFVTQSVADLRALRMSTPAQPTDEFLAAGSPWYLTLFGRDSIWAARMLLPLGVDLAAGTLRTLAARQGTVHDVDRAEEPGKILHEIRRVAPAGSGQFLPPVYYGTVDATPLWVVPAGRRMAMGDGGPGGGGAAARRRTGVGVDGRRRGQRRRRLPGVRGQVRLRPDQPGVEGLVGLGPVRGRAGRGRGRWPWPRCSPMRSRPPFTAPTCWRRSAGPAPTGGARTLRGCSCVSARSSGQSMIWGPTRCSPSTGPSTASTLRRRTWGTCCPAGSCRRPRRSWSRTGWSTRA